MKKLLRALWQRRWALVPLSLIGTSLLAVAVLAILRNDAASLVLAVAGIGALLWFCAASLFRRRRRRLSREFLKQMRRIRTARIRTLIDSNRVLTASRIAHRRPATLPTNLIRTLSRELWKRGYWQKALELRTLTAARSGLPADATNVAQMEGAAAFLRGDNLPRLEQLPVTPVSNDRILHVVKQSLRDAQAGYTLRTHKIASSQARQGLDVHIVTQLGRYDPSDLESEWEDDGVKYHRLAGPAQQDLRHDEWFALHVQALSELVQELRPAVLHAASDFVNARAARLVGNAHGIPIIYEVRGFWEETMISSLARRFSWGPITRHAHRFGHPDSYLWRQASEAQERRLADAVVTLAPVMAEKIIREGVAADKIMISPNAIDPDEFTPLSRDRPLLRSLGFRDDTTVIGYISSLSEYEGVDVLIRAFAKLRAKTRPHGLGLLIVGDGTDMARLKEVADEVGAENIVFAGKVPHESVSRYYSIIDAFIVPRHPVTVCHLVTPLKPYEAFALQRAVIMSDVDALAGIATESQSAHLFRAGDLDDLAKVIEKTLDDDSGRITMARQAREWVIRERTWSHNVKIYKELYQTLTSQNRRRSVSVREEA